MEYFIIGFCGCVLSAWLYSEYHFSAPLFRIAFGIAVMIVLFLVNYALVLRNEYSNGHHRAAIQMLGEAIDAGEVQAARNAIDEYLTIEPRASGIVIVDRLADLKTQEAK